MSAEDDAYEYMMMEQYQQEQLIEKCVCKYSSHKVVRDAIQSFRNQKVNETSKLETISRDILKTVARTKRMSDKQKKCLVKLMVFREDIGYV